MLEGIAGPLVHIVVKAAAGVEVESDHIIAVEITTEIVIAGTEVLAIVIRRGIPSRIGEDRQILGVIRYGSIKQRFRLVNAASTCICSYLSSRVMAICLVYSNFIIISSTFSS